MIEINNLTKKYAEDGPLVLDGLTFETPSGGTLAVIGPSGCGKTTLLYILGGLLKATSGQILIDGKTVGTDRKQTSFIFQDFGLLPWKTAMQNACVGMSINGIGKKRQKEIVESLFKELGIYARRNSYPIQLSGGEKQRVAIARSLAVNPDLLLMDEPFSALDAMTREKLQDIMLAEWRERNFTMVLVTHSIEEAVYLGGSIMILSNRPARIERIIKNPACGTKNHRLKDEYFQVIKEVRSSMDNLSKNSPDLTKIQA